MPRRVPTAALRAVAAAAVTAVTLPLTLVTVQAAQADPAATTATTTTTTTGTATAQAVEPFDALVFSRTAGFRHDSIPAGVAAVQQLGAANGFTVTATEDPGVFTDAGLADYEVVVFLSTTGDVLDAEQQAAFERYIQGGGGYAGIHAASDTEYAWSWYGGLVGAYFSDHPANQTATIKVEDHAHESTAHLPQRWERYDEWYNFRTNPRDTVHVLASLDETTYSAGSGAMGAEHPTAWCQVYDGGRSWYTGGGHTQEAYAEPEFLQHLLGGIRTAAGVVDSDCNASQSAGYEVVPLDEGTANPMMLDVAADGTVFYAERDGRVRLIDPATRQTTTAATLPVTLANEDGLTGIVLDPGFAENRWVYLFWSPSDVGADGPHNRVSRFTYDPATRTLPVASEAVVLKITTQRETCCHAGGDMQFDPDGNLYVVTGDNTNPFESAGYAPIDERPGRQNYDAQRTSANSADLRGKVLRIRPEPGGGYTVPEGNMFAPGTPQTRPEIFAMGFRNPFRIGVDPATGNVLVGDYGPDAGSADPLRGPAGTVEWNVVSEPGFYGWPYCTGSNNAYVDHDFATGQSGASFDCAGGVVNGSPNNTGLRQLPPAVEAEVWFGYSTNPLFPEIGGGGAPMGGPVYDYDPDLASDVKWPAYWDGKAFFGEWNQGRVYSFQLDGPERDDLVDINRVLPQHLDPAAGFDRPMDMDFGPDGALYVIDWGEGFGGNNDTSGIYRVDYVRGDPAPIARAAADVTSGPAPLTVQFSSEGTRHPAGEPLSLQWTFGDGSAPSTEADPVHTYTANGSYTAQLVATDPSGQTGVANVTVVVGNVAPTVTITFPDDGGFFEWGDQVRYEIEVTDPDGTVDCSAVHLYTSLGHDSHAHPMEELTGCQGVLQTARDEGHGIEANIFWVIEGSYADDGGAAGVPLTGNDLQVLQPKLVQAEFYTSTGRLAGSTSGGDPGVRVETTGDTAGGGQNIGFIETDDWWAYEPVSLDGVDAVTLRAASPSGGGPISLRWGAPDGPEIGSVTVPATGAWQTYTDVTAALHDVPAGSGTLYLVHTAGQVNVNWLEFEGRGVTENVRPEITSFEVDPLSGTAPLVVSASAAATDAEGDAVTLAWDAGLGGGFQDGTGTFTTTYTEPGTYRLQVRATDARGAYSVRYETVTVRSGSGGPALCFSGRSDDFTGADLDPARWEVLDRDQNLRVVDGELVVPATVADIYGTNNTAVPNVVLQDLPDGPFTATARLTIEADARYQQAGLLLYDGPDDYAKMVIEGRSAPADPATRIFQFIRETGGAPNEVAASNTAALGAGYPSTVYVRFTSTDGTSLRASYSADGLTFTDMPETKSLAGLTDPRIGLVALAGTGSQAPVVDARFDWFHITPDDTAAAPGPDDEFGGTELDGCRWSVVRPDPDGLRVADGSLQIDTTPTDIYGSGNTGVPNIVLQDQPDGGWTVQTRVDGSSFDRQYHQGGLIVYGDDDNYVKLDLVTDNQAGQAPTRRIELRSEVGGTVQNPQPNAEGLTSGAWWLRLSRSGTTFTASYSADGETWTDLPEAVTNQAVAGAGVGLYALGGAQTAAVTASFDHFRVVDGGAPLAVAGALAPSEPDGPEGSWLGPVTVTVAATGGPAGAQVYREVNVDGGGWAEYTSPLVVTSPGAHVVELRASAGGVTVTGETVRFTIAAPEPLRATPAVDVVQASCTVDEAGANVRAGGTLGPVVTQGVASYAVQGLVDGEPAGEPADLGDLAPGRYVVVATPEEGWTLDLPDGWTAGQAGTAELVVTIARYGCDRAPAVELAPATCDAGAVLTLVRVPGVKGYAVHVWADGAAVGKPGDLGDLAPGQYLVTATPDRRVDLDPDPGWVLSPSGKATLLVTVGEVSCD
ncbi:ThuA domain-containing protein [Antribacter sp. KLBMP9083]|uniref:ThuA domain-containing protein n=1 Tax=Antribacter soli TaxID=2910976 RepID=A0AA41U851_9MICO|nr:ThuA domain-containing protein [Antribacter soli]